MRRFRGLGLHLSLWVSLFLLAGCGKGSWPMSKGSQGGVAVVDLNVVASRLGRADEMRDLVKQKNEALTQDLARLQKACQNELRLKTEAFSEERTKEEEQQEQELKNKLSATFTQAQQNAQNELKTYESSLLTRFRDDVRVVARTIAAEKGLSLVVTKSDLFLVSVEPEFEITDAVIDKMRVNLAPMVAANQPSKSERAAQKVINKEERAADAPPAPTKKSKKSNP